MPTILETCPDWALRKRYHLPRWHNATDPASKVSWHCDVCGKLMPRSEYRVEHGPKGEVLFTCAHHSPPELPPLPALYREGPAEGVREYRFGPCTLFYATGGSEESIQLDWANVRIGPVEGWEHALRVYGRATHEQKDVGIVRKRHNAAVVLVSGHGYDSLVNAPRKAVLADYRGFSCRTGRHDQA